MRSACLILSLAACDLYWGQGERQRHSDARLADGRPLSTDVGATTPDCDSHGHDATGPDAALDASSLYDARRAVDATAPDSATDAAVVQASDLFSARFDFASVPNPLLVLAADFNSDGAPDVAIFDFTSSTFSIRLNTTAAGSTTPSFSFMTNLPTANGATSAAVADVNSDGRPDIVVAAGSANLGAVSVYINTTPTGATKPTFAPRLDLQAIHGSGGPGSVQIADINHDGRPDLLAVVDSRILSVWLNVTAPGAGSASFGSRFDLDLGSWCNWLGPASDMNGDDVPDVVVGNTCTNADSILLNTTPVGAATPSLGAAVPFMPGNYPLAIAIADFNGDWRPDIATSFFPTNNVLNGAVSVMLNATTLDATIPVFSPAADVATFQSPAAFAVADFDHDGRLDVAVADSNSYSATAGVVILLNTTIPNGTSASFQNAGTLVDPNDDSLTTADFNGDGKADLAVANGGASSFSIFLGR